MRGFVVFVLMIFSAVAGRAGPWPREVDRTFLALAMTGQTDSLWAERGLGRGRWLALDGWYNAGSAEWLVGVTYHRAMRDRAGWAMAWSAGVTVGMPETDITLEVPVIRYPSTWQAVVKLRPILSARLGMSLGRPLVRPWPGWVALDLRLDANTLDQRIKADATAGYRPRPRWAVIGQVQTELAKGTRPQLHLASSVVWKASDKVSLELGLRHGLHDRKTQIKLGNWVEF